LFPLFYEICSDKVKKFIRSLHLIDAGMMTTILRRVAKLQKGKAIILQNNFAPFSVFLASIYSSYEQY